MLVGKGSCSSNVSDGEHSPAFVVFKSNAPTITQQIPTRSLYPDLWTRYLVELLQNLFITDSTFRIIRIDRSVTGWSGVLHSQIKALCRACTTLVSRRRRLVLAKDSCNISNHNRRIANLSRLHLLQSTLIRRIKARHLEHCVMRQADES